MISSLPSHTSFARSESNTPMDSHVFGIGCKDGKSSCSLSHSEFMQKCIFQSLISLDVLECSRDSCLRVEMLLRLVVIVLIKCTHYVARNSSCQSIYEGFRSATSTRFNMKITFDSVDALFLNQYPDLFNIVGCYFRRFFLFSRIVLKILLKPLN